MREFIFEDNLGESTFPLTMLFDATVDDTNAVAASEAIVEWAWADEPDMEPQFLGRQTVGFTLSVPFENPDRRPIRFFVNGATKDGNRTVNDIRKARQTTFYPPETPILVSAIFDSGTDDVTLTFAGNGGEDSIRILRSIDGGDFAHIATVDFDETTYVDSPVLDGDYTYKLTQVNVKGTSNSIEVAVNVGVPAAGSPPSALSTTYDDVGGVTLNWTNNGGTGDNIIERKENIDGTYAPVATEISSATSSADVVPYFIAYNVLYFYRVYNESVAGYSNEATVYVPRDEGIF
jgi:hypothetical protein